MQQRQQPIEPAIAVEGYCRWRFADPKLPVIRSRAGFCRGIFRDPDSTGFFRDDQGRWQSPPPRAYRSAATAAHRASMSCNPATRCFR